MRSLRVRALLPLLALPLLAARGAAPAHPAPRGCGTAASAARGVAPAARAAGAEACAEATPALAATGKAVFMGKGNCYTCHGMDAKGTPLAPSLAQHKWINIDGSFPAIQKLVTTGVPHPKEHPAPMPAMGGAQLAPGEVCAVAAYVYRLSHKS